MRWLLVLLAGCASAQVAPTFAMESAHGLVVQVTSDKGDVRDCETFWNLFRKSSSQVCETRHRRSQRWVTVGGAAVSAEGAVDEDARVCVVDGDRVRCGDQRVSAAGGVVVDRARPIDGCTETTRVAGGEVCLGGDGYRAGQFFYKPDGGTVASTPAEVVAVAVDGRTATIVHHDAFGARIGTLALDDTLRVIRWRDFAFAGPSDRVHADNTIVGVTPSGSHVVVRRGDGCDVVEVTTGDALREACGELVGDAAYLVGGTLIDLASGARRALGPLHFLAQTDRALMIAQEPDRVVAIRRADAMVAVMPVAAERVVVSDRFIAAAGQGKLAVIDRATMAVRVDDIGEARGAIGIAGDTVLVALRGHRMLAVTDGRKAILPLGK